MAGRFWMGSDTLANRGHENTALCRCFPSNIIIAPLVVGVK